MKCILNMKSVVAYVLCAILSSGVIVGTGIAANTEKVANLPILIQSVQMRGEGLASELVVTASVPSTYTSYKTTAPHRFVIDFSQAVPVEGLTTIHVNKGPVKDVTVKRFDTDAGVLTRMEIFLTQDIEPKITPSSEKLGELNITFPGFKPVDLPQTVQVDSKPVTVSELPAQATSSEMSAPSASNEKVEVKNSVSVAATPDSTGLLLTSVSGNAGAIEIMLNGVVSDFKMFRLNKPERVVVDIPNAKSGTVDKLVQLNVAGVSTARIGSYPDKVRVVFDSINGSLADATIEKSVTGLRVQFGTISASIPSARPSTAPIIEKTDENTNKDVQVAKKSDVAAIKQVSAIDFQVLDGFSRVTVKTGSVPLFDAPIKAAGSVSFRIKNVQLPRNLQRSFDTRDFITPVLRITPVQVKTKSGYDVLIRVALKTDQPFELRSEADLLVLDIKNPVKTQNTKADSQVSSGSKKSTSTKPSLIQDDQLSNVINNQSSNAGKSRFSGRKITLEFADAEVRKIFQLLAEVSNKNFVLGDEVTGNISLKLINVPWDQALDVIIKTKEFDMYEDTNNIVIIRGKGKVKSLVQDDGELRKTKQKTEELETEVFTLNYAKIEEIKTQFDALKSERGATSVDPRTNKVIVRDIKSALSDMKNLLKSLDIPEKQVMIEARIIEASSDFSRSLGVSWGLGTNPDAGGKHFPFINSVDSVFGGLVSNSGASAIGSTVGAADISFGTIGSNVKLSMRLNAAAKAGLLKFISSPKVATLNHRPAKITSGKQIPYISATSDKIETKFVEAALSLEITPHINNNGTIVLKIDAKNDSVDTTSTSATPPINKKQATTEMLLKDGETTIIGGIFSDSETQGEEGLPWLMDVPILGNLFKSTSFSKSKSELLIFITPRILKSSVE
jgi:type IV pilus assembly protein PilQ